MCLRDGGVTEGSDETSSVRTLVGGVGYRFLRDFSLGPVLADELAREAWPPEVAVEDLGYGPVAIVQRLQEARPPFRRLVLVGAARRGRAPGAVTAYLWDRSLPDTEEIQARVSEAVTGVVDLDNLVVVAGALGGAPAEVVVVEVEPDVEEHGETFTPVVAEAAERARARVRELALAPAPLPLEAAPPGGPDLPGAEAPPARRE